MMRPLSAAVSDAPCATVTPFARPEVSWNTGLKSPDPFSALVLPDNRPFRKVASATLSVEATSPPTFTWAPFANTMPL
jgi:hypothetical protein